MDGKLSLALYTICHLPRMCRQTLATGMILSRISYLIQVWGGTEEKYMSIIQTLLNETARFMTGLPRRTSTRRLMTACNWLYAREMTVYFDMITMWNVTLMTIFGSTLYLPGYTSLSHHTGGELHLSGTSLMTICATTTHWIISQ